MRDPYCNIPDVFPSLQFVRAQLMDRDRLGKHADTRSLIEPLVADDRQDGEEVEDSGNPELGRGHSFETRVAVSEGYRSDGAYEEPPRRVRHSLLSTEYDYVPGEAGLGRAHYARTRPLSPAGPDRPWNQRVFSRISHRKQVRRSSRARTICEMQIKSVTPQFLARSRCSYGTPSNV